MHPYIVCLAFRSNGRRATMSTSPFSIKCDTCPYYAHLPSKAKGDTHYRYASLIWCSCPKISGSTRSLPTLSKISKNFHLPSSLHSGHCCNHLLSSSTHPSSTLALELATIIDPSPRAHHSPQHQPRS
jgi:hypothetical protein